MNAPSITFTVRATAITDEEFLEDDDLEVAGDHYIELPATAANWSDSDQAKAVLDAFHHTVAVGMLEDFEFAVLTSDGREIVED